MTSRVSLFPRGSLVLAPMAGYSDEPFRRICRRMGSAASYTEFVSADALVRRNAKTLKILRYAEEERPVIFQLFGNRVSVLVEAALRAQELGPDGIDLNLGCSVQKVAQKGSGAALLRDPLQAGRIMEALARNLSVPVSAKMRLGWDEAHRNYLEVARILQESGASMIAVHGRTALQAYRGEADWNAVAEIKASLSIPVFGNGDVKSHADAKKKMRLFGVDGVLIGRAALGNPWIFNEELDGRVSSDQTLDMMEAHLRAMLCYHGPLHGPLRFRKHALHYLRGFPGAAAARTRMLSARTGEEMLNAINWMREIGHQHLPDDGSD